MKGNGDLLDARQSIALLRELSTLAIQITLEAPARFSGPGHFTYVQRQTVTRIRAVLDAHGVDWRSHHAALRKT